MAKQFAGFEDEHTAFVRAQHVFFVATATADGRINLSPKGGDALRIIGANRILWRNITGSGNETAGHLLQSARMTLMWCSFTERPIILRAFGTARTVHRACDDWDTLNGHFPAHAGARQVFDMTVEMVQSSCGYAVPLMDFVSDRSTLDQWSDNYGAQNMPTYWREKNQTTIDGHPTGIPTK